MSVERHRQQGGAEEWERRIAGRIVEASGVSQPQELGEVLGDVVDPDALHYLLSLEAIPAGGEGELDGLIPDEIRRERGVYFTPPQVAAQMAECLDDDIHGVAIDLSCGHGALLQAVVEHRPDLDVVGVEREPVLAVAAALRVVQARGEARTGDRVLWGDGLAEHVVPGSAAAVLGNPPYVREKGNRALFGRLRDEHPHLRDYFGARIDLHYLFLHRALDVLRQGGQMVYLTSEYWLAATGAQTLRDDLVRRADIEDFRRLGGGVFESAPGHHSLIFTARKNDGGAAEQPEGIVAGGAWAPFASVPRLEGPPLRELLLDRQGFVSGADRATKPVRKKLDREVPHGAPVFLWKRDELPPDDLDLFRPLLRRSDCRANRVVLEPPGGEFVLWADGTEDAATAERLKVLLEPFRAALESRREARKGTMPWYRIWWPRNTEEYARPKLVVPRRCTDAAVTLDLSGAHVSSDCTFLTARPGLEPVPSLLAAMLVLNSDATIEHLRQYGKTKGDVIEFYSDPLRRLPLVVEVEEGVLVPDDSKLRQRWEHARRILDQADRPWIDV